MRGYKASFFDYSDTTPILEPLHRRQRQTYQRGDHDIARISARCFLSSHRNLSFFIMRISFFMHTPLSGA